DGLETSLTAADPVRAAVARPATALEAIGAEITRPAARTAEAAVASRVATFIVVRARGPRRPTRVARPGGAVPGAEVAVARARGAGGQEAGRENLKPGPRQPGQDRGARRAGKACR